MAFGTRPSPISGSSVKGGKLLEVGADLTGRDLSGARVIDLEETDYILPGLFDLHAHYEVELFGSGRVDELEVNPVVYLANGVTTTFTAGESNPDRVIEAKKRIDTGFQVGPRILSAGLRVGVGRQGRLRVDATVQDIYDEVDYWVARGVGGFKAKSIRPEHLQALIDRAHLHGLTVTGHLSSGYLNTVNPRDAILMGIDRIEHFLGGDAFAPDVDPYVSLARIDTATTEFRDIIELFIRHRVHFNPTTRAFGYIGSRGPGFEQWVDERKLYTPYVQELAGLNAAMRQGSARFDSIQTIALATVKAFYGAGGQDLISPRHRHAREGGVSGGIHGAPGARGLCPGRHIACSCYQIRHDQRRASPQPERPAGLYRVGEVRRFVRYQGESPRRHSQHAQCPHRDEIRNDIRHEGASGIGDRKTRPGRSRGRTRVEPCQANGVSFPAPPGALGKQERGRRGGVGWDGLAGPMPGRRLVISDCRWTTL